MSDRDRFGSGAPKYELDPTTPLGRVFEMAQSLLGGTEFDVTRDGDHTPAGDRLGINIEHTIAAVYADGGAVPVEDSELEEPKVFASDLEGINKVKVCLTFASETEGDNDTLSCFVTWNGSLYVADSSANCLLEEPALLPVRETALPEFGLLLQEIFRLQANGEFLPPEAEERVFGLIARLRHQLSGDEYSEAASQQGFYETAAATISDRPAIWLAEVRKTSPDGHELVIVHEVNDLEGGPRNYTQISTVIPPRGRFRPREIEQILTFETGGGTYYERRVGGVVSPSGVAERPATDKYAQRFIDFMGRDDLQDSDL